MIVKDILGQEIKEGDYVARASGGSYVELLPCKVIKINPKGSITLDGGRGNSRADVPERSCLRLSGDQIEAYLRQEEEV